MFGEGVYVQGIKYPGNAMDAGLRTSDVIVKVDNKSVKTIGDVRSIYEAVVGDEEREKKVMFEVMRGGLRKWIVLDYHKDYEEE
jgi:S1-C subfamily serine protease